MKKTLFIVIIAVVFRRILCECRQSHSTTCDSFKDIEQKQNEIFQATELIIGHEDVPASPMISFEMNSFSSVNYKKLVSLIIVGQINRIPTLDAQCEFDHDLTLLSFYKNNIKTLEPFSFPKLKLKKLSMVDNNIEVIEKRAFGNIIRIDIIDLSHNKIEAIDSYVFFSYGDRNKIKKIINLANNLIADIQPDSFPEKLKILNLEHNKLRHIQDGVLDNLKFLQELTLHHNRLYKMPNLTSSTKLEILDLSYNNIETISNTSLQRLKNLQFLNLDSNKIKNAAFSDFSFLLSEQRALISLGFNKLIGFSFENVEGSFENFELFLFGNPWDCKEWNEIKKSMTTLKIEQNACDLQFFSAGNTPYCLDYTTIFYLDVDATVTKFLKSIETNKKLISCTLVPENFVLQIFSRCVA